MSNHKDDDEVQIIEDSPNETMPLQQRLRGINARRSVRLSNLRAEREHASVVLTRGIDRAASLPVERKSYLYEYFSEEKERGYSMQREVVFIC